MKRDEASQLPVSTRVRGKVYADGRWSYGTVVESALCGKGIRFDDYFYPFADDCHGFADMSDRLLETLEVIQ